MISQQAGQYCIYIKFTSNLKVKKQQQHWYPALLTFGRYVHSKLIVSQLWVVGY